MRRSRPWLPSECFRPVHPAQPSRSGPLPPKGTLAARGRGTLVRLSGPHAAGPSSKKPTRSEAVAAFVFFPHPKWGSCFLFTPRAQSSHPLSSSPFAHSLTITHSLSHSLTHHSVTHSLTHQRSLTHSLITHSLNTLIIIASHSHTYHHHTLTRTLTIISAIIITHSPICE